MLRAIRSLFFLLAILLSPIFASGQQEKKIRVLLIGNSFSQNATRYLDQITAAKGYTIEFGRAEIGGCSLQRHWDSVAASVTDTTRGKLYSNRKLSLLNFLQRGNWDVITIQQASMQSGDSATYQPYGKNLYTFIKKYQPNARILVHQTWPYRSDAKVFGKIDGEQQAVSQKEMWEKSRMAYHKLAKDLNLDLFPSGDAFYAVATNSKWAFVKDTAFNYNTVKPPSLPVQKNSLNIGYALNREGELTFDPNHANEAGCYLLGLVWYAVLFNENPKEVQFKPESISAAFASFLKQTAYSTVKNLKRKKVK